MWTLTGLTIGEMYNNIINLANIKGHQILATERRLVCAHPRNLRSLEFTYLPPPPRGLSTMLSLMLIS